jgi:hypothetical protein
MAYPVHFKTPGALRAAKQTVYYGNEIPPESVKGSHAYNDRGRKLTHWQIVPS